MSPNLSNITCFSNRHAPPADWLAYTIFQLKPLESVSQCTWVDALSKSRTWLPGSFNGREALDNEIVLQNTLSTLNFLAVAMILKYIKRIQMKTIVLEEKMPTAGWRPLRLWCRVSDWSVRAAKGSFHSDRLWLVNVEILITCIYLCSCTEKRCFTSPGGNRFDRMCVYQLQKTTRFVPCRWRQSQEIFKRVFKNVRALFGLT